jgi:hypothetical protein
MPGIKDSAKSAQRKGRDLDTRYRDRDGEIRHKNGNTLVGTLRETYGENFAKGYRNDAKLSTILKETRAKSLDDLLRNRSDTRVSDSSRAILDDATVKYRNALKRLADK